eukprot:3929773-Pyramimonas_sp.AAC.1
MLFPWSRAFPVSSSSSSRGTVAWLGLIVVRGRCRNGNVAACLGVRCCSFCGSAARGGCCIGVCVLVSNWMGSLVTVPSDASAGQSVVSSVVWRLRVLWRCPLVVVQVGTVASLVVVVLLETLLVVVL